MYCWILKELRTRLVFWKVYTMMHGQKNMKLYYISFCWTWIINRLVSSYQLNAHFLYSITIYMLHYNPQHVSSSTLLIFRRTNFIFTESGIVTLCRRPYSMSVESGGCNNTICPPEDEQGTARNMLRIIM